MTEIMTNEQLDALLLEFLTAYIRWCDTDENPESFKASGGLCANILDFQCARKIGSTEDGYWLLWDHQEGYFPVDDTGIHVPYPFGMRRDEPDDYDYRKNTKRTNWARMMIDKLTVEK